MKTKHLHDFNTYHCYRNEIYLSGRDENGKDFTIGEPENPLKSRENFLKN